jgi:subtilisin family serine protease
MRKRSKQAKLTGSNEQENGKRSSIHRNFVRVIFLLVICTIQIILLAQVFNSSLWGSDWEYTPTEMIVKTTVPLNIRGNDFSIPELDTFLAQYEVKEIKAVTPSAENRFYVVRFEEALDWEGLKRQNLRFDGIEYLQPNYLNEFFQMPNDPFFSSQVLELMNIPQAWQHQTGSQHIIVAVVDSGLWFEHPEFYCQDTGLPLDNIWINQAEYPPNGEDSSGNGYVDDWRGWDFVDAPELEQIALGDYLGQDNEPFDESGHGTHVAGIIGAAVNNDQGIAGVCWDVKLMILRAGFRTTIGPGYLQDDDAAAAIIYAADNGAHIINLSWGSTTFSPIIADACQYAYEKGVIIVASAGNIPGPEIMYPAKLNSTISVGSVNNNLTLTGFTSYGPDLDLVAPGAEILSTYIEQSDGSIYYRSSGTSMSSPFVAGAMALLLAHEPGLSIAEARSRLFSSATDLGVTGFDNYFGHGLLNAEGLLTITGHPYINVSSPSDMTGISGSFEITGKISSPDFFRYSVMFTDHEFPTSMDWKDVVTHQNVPRFYYNQVNDDEIASFHVPLTLPDNEYLVRIKMETLQAEAFEKRFRVHINQKPPEMKENQLVVRKRYRGEIPYYFVTTEFDQPVTAEMMVYSHTGQSANVYTNYADSLHILQIPESLPEGEVSLQINALSISGLEYSSPLFENVVTIDKTGIPTDSFEQTEIGPALITIPKSHDFDNNGFYEFIGMIIEDGQTLTEVKVFEFKHNLLEEQHHFDTPFLPLDMGKTDNQKMKILGLIGDTIHLIDTPTGNIYPNQIVWSQGNVVGGNITDLSNNGNEDLALIRNFQNTRVISLYQQTEPATLEETNILFNQTETDELNIFVPRIASADLNRNGYINVLASDTDGDIMVYEIYNTAADSLIWHQRLPIGNLYHLSAGDFTGDGYPEFCVGGYSSDYTDTSKNFWYFEFFGFSEAEDEFISLGYLSFDHFDQVNSIKAIDLDGDGSLELVFALTPHLFIIDYVEGEFQPIWKGSAARTYNVVPIPATDFNPAGVIINDNDEQGTLKSHFVSKTDYSGPPSPIGLIAQPMNESTVELSWNSCFAEYYLVYRKHEDTITLIDSTTVTIFTDEDLLLGEEYSYALKSVNHDYNPAVSRFSAWQRAVPFTVPELLSLTMTAPNELRLLFNVQLNNEAINVGHYNVNNGIGRPFSVNHTENQRGLLLRFNKPLPEPEEDYYLHIAGLKGSSGVPLPESNFYFSYSHDLGLPEITSHEIIEERILKIVFSKDIDPVVAENEANFVLDLPQIDISNSILSIQCIDNLVHLTFNEKLKVSNSPYYLVMNNITDLSGNPLPNNQNILRFQLPGTEDLKLVQVVPNPFVRTQHHTLQFIGLPAEIEGELSVYSIAGEKVFSDKIAPVSVMNNSYLWQVTNNSRKTLSSGMYIYILRMGDVIKRGQIAIIN